MDKRVYLFFAFVFLLAAGSFSFRYANYEPCVEVDFMFDTLEPKVGASIQFRDNSDGAKEWQWDFGDDTDVKTKQNEIHVFEEPGFYEVTLMVNGRCELTKPIYVEADVKELDPSKFPKFNLPKSITVGQRLVVTAKSDIAETWEWRFGESIKVDATTKTARHIYRRPGRYTVSLIINDELDYLVKKTIRVNPLIEEYERITPTTITSEESVLDLPDAPMEEEPAEIEVAGVEEDSPVPFPIIEEVPVFPGCENSTNKRACFQEMIIQHIQVNFNYPEFAEEKGIQGKVDVTFTILKDGSVGGINARGPHTSLEDAARRIMYNLPRLVPGKQDGKPVDVPFSIPINFKLEESPSKEKPVKPSDTRPILNEDMVIGNLRGLSKGKMSSQEFTKYFCEDKNPFVLANGRSYTFDKFSKLIKGKNVILKNITWGSENKCLYSFEINFTR